MSSRRPRIAHCPRSIRILYAALPCLFYFHAYYSSILSPRSSIPRAHSPIERCSPPCSPHVIVSFLQWIDIMICNEVWLCVTSSTCNQLQSMLPSITANYLMSLLLLLEFESISVIWVDFFVSVVIPFCRNSYKFLPSHANVTVKNWQQCIAHSWRYPTVTLTAQRTGIIRWHVSFFELLALQPGSKWR